MNYLAFGVGFRGVKIMSKLEEIIEEYNELKSYKEKYEFLLKDYNRKVESLYKFELEKWENAKPQDRQKYYKEHHCRCCRFFSDVKGERCRISSNICKPKLETNDNGQKIITYQGCPDFEWD